MSRPDRAGGDLNRTAALAGLAVSIVLVLLKAWATWRTGSAALLASLADSAFDLIASLATLAAVWIATQPADEAHRFGHGKAEAIGAMFQLVLISISAMGIAFHAVQRLLSDARTEAAAEGIAVSVVAIVITLMLVTWQRRVVSRTGSLAIATDRVHYQSDLLLNLGVIAALGLEQYAHLRGADSVFGLAIALWLGWSAWRASRAAIEQLMDREWPPEKRERLLAAIARHPDLKGVHDLRTRTSGNKDFAQFHVWVDPQMTVGEAHRVMDQIEARLRAEIPDVEILIHPDPVGLIDEQGLAAQDILPRGGPQGGKE